MWREWGSLTGGIYGELVVGRCTEVVLGRDWRDGSTAKRSSRFVSTWLGRAVCCFYLFTESAHSTVFIPSTYSVLLALSSVLWTVLFSILISISDHIGDRYIQLRPTLNAIHRLGQTVQHVFPNPSPEGVRARVFPLERQYDLKPRQ